MVLKNPSQHFHKDSLNKSTNSRTPEHHHISEQLSGAYIQTTFVRYCLHSPHEQFCGHHFLISDLKSLKFVSYFDLVGATSQVLEPKMVNV